MVRTGTASFSNSAEVVTINTARPMAAATRLAQTASHVAPSPAMVHPFEATPLAPPDSIFQLTSSYKADDHPQKVNLGVGAYRDDDGKPWVLPVVKKAKRMIADDEGIDHEYLPINGLPAFVSASSKLILGADSAVIKEQRVAACQTISGTGANHLGGLFLAKFYGPWQTKPASERVVHLSNPTWANHKAIFNNLGLTTKDYNYYDPKTIGLDFSAFCSSLESAPNQSVFLLHACAHNPTGIDPTPEQWNQIITIFLSKQHFAFFDCAYQGFASGNLDRDAEAVRLFAQRKIPMLICQSFAKNMGLYGERVGCLNVIGTTSEETKKISSQVSVLQRSEISNPPTFGARIASLILNDATLFEEWKDDVRTMAHRIISTRQQLRDLLEQKYKSPRSFEMITQQIGMFSFTGLDPNQVKAMVEHGHVYMTANGRISMAGLNSKNIDYVAQCIDKAIRGEL